MVVWRGGEEKTNDPRSMVKGWYHRRWSRHTPWAVWLTHKHDAACTHYRVMVVLIIIYGAEGPRLLSRDPRAKACEAPEN